jgi:HEAT repeat protein
LFQKLIFRQFFLSVPDNFRQRKIVSRNNQPGADNNSSVYYYQSMNRGRGGQRMVPENTEGSTAMVKETKTVGTVDEELKKIYDEMKAQVAEVPEYIRLLKTGSLLERRKSAEALGEIGDERGVLPLIDALRDSSTTVQYVAAKSLGMLADKRAVDPLINLTKSEDKWVRLGAAHALGLIGDKKAVDAILPLLTDTHHDLRVHAAWALGKLMDARAVEALKPLLEDPKEDVRTEAKAALGMLGVK